MAQSPNVWDDNLESKHPARGYPAPSHDDAGEETNTDMEIMEEGAEGKTVGPVLATVRGQLDFTPITYWIGCSLVTEADLDKYVEWGLIKALLRSLCRALGLEEVPHPEP